MEIVLAMFRADGERRSFPVSREMTIIGRGEDCDLRIPLGEVSRKHCRLIRDGDALRMEDLGSSNGTYVNGERVQGERVLEPGDTIRVGPVLFVLQVNGVPADDELRPHEGAAAGPSDETGATGAHAEGSEEFDPMSALEGELDAEFEFPGGESNKSGTGEIDLEKSKHDEELEG